MSRLVLAFLLSCALLGGGDSDRPDDSAARGYAAERGDLPPITGSKAFTITPPPRVGRVRDAR